MKNRNFEILEFIIPEYAVCPLIYGDFSGVEDEDEKEIMEFVDRCIEDYGNALFTPPEDESLMESEFRVSNDISNLGCDCVTLILMVEIE